MFRVNLYSGNTLVDSQDFKNFSDAEAYAHRFVNTRGAYAKYTIREI